MYTIKVFEDIKKSLTPKHSRNPVTYLQSPLSQLSQSRTALLFVSKIKDFNKQGA